jgi:hypothetical protein
MSALTVRFGHRAPPGVAQQATGVAFAVLGTVAQTGSRWLILREAADSILRRGAYSRSVEKLTPAAAEPLAVIYIFSALLATLAGPKLWRVFPLGAVSNFR